MELHSCLRFHGTSVENGQLKLLSVCRRKSSTSVGLCALLARASMSWLQSMHSLRGTRMSRFTGTNARLPRRVPAPAAVPLAYASRYAETL